MQHVDDCAVITLPRGELVVRGRQRAGKPRAFLPYAAGVDFYRAACDAVVARNYLGFKMSGLEDSHCHDGVVRRLQPDVEMVLNELAVLNLPPRVDDRGRRARIRGSLGGELSARSGRGRGHRRHPARRGRRTGVSPLPSADHRSPSDRRTSTAAAGFSETPPPTIRCAGTFACGPTRSSSRRTTATRRSIGSPPRWTTAQPRCDGSPTTRRRSAAYRDSSPSAAGAREAVSRRWCAGSHAISADRSSSAGIAFTHDRLRPDPRVLHRERGRLRPHRGAGAVVLRTHADAADRSDPRISPLRAGDLSGLPPAIVVTGEFDPLRDEGDAYAAALAAAGVPTEHVRARGHTHASLTMVDMVISGEPIRARIADALRRFADTAPA